MAVIHEINGKKFRMERSIQLMCTGCGCEWWAPIHHMCLNCNDPDAIVLFGNTTTELIPVLEEEPEPEPAVQSVVMFNPAPQTPLCAQACNVKNEFKPSISRSVRGSERCLTPSSLELSELHLRFPWFGDSSNR